MFGEGIVHGYQLQRLLCDERGGAGETLGEDDLWNEVYRGASLLPSLLFLRFLRLSLTDAPSLSLSLFSSQLGALRFDRDLRSIANFLSSQTAFGGSREKFIRLQQISTVLNLGSVSSTLSFLPFFSRLVLTRETDAFELWVWVEQDEDAKEFWGQSGIPWRLSRSEYDSVAALRI